MIVFYVISTVALLASLFAILAAAHFSIVLNNYTENLENIYNDLNKRVNQYVNYYIAKLTVDNAESENNNNNENNTKENETIE